MDEDISKFCNFLDSYKDTYLKSFREISIPKSDDEIDDEKNRLKPLVSSNFKLLDFDAMCDGG